MGTNDNPNAEMAKIVAAQTLLETPNTVSQVTGKGGFDTVRLTAQFINSLTNEQRTAITLTLANAINPSTEKALVDITKYSAEISRLDTESKRLGEEIKLNEEQPLKFFLKHSYEDFKDIIGLSPTDKSLQQNKAQATTSPAK